MSINQPNLTKPKIEIQPSDPKLWEVEDQICITDFFKLLIEIDMRNNPENYKPNANQPNSKSYESNNHIRNTSNTGEA